MVRLILILSAVASFFMFASAAAAQTLGGAAPVQYIVTPEVPAPGDQVEIEVQGVGNFLGDASITWTQDGKTAQSGVGDKTFTFTAGPLGSKTTVGVSISSSVKGNISQTFTFIPSIVNMLWEADTSVPPFYRGKALYTAGSNLTVVALPQVVSGGKTLTAGSLSFQWEIDGTPLTQQSGLGANRITFKGSQLLSGETVSVDVLQGGVMVAHGKMTVPASKPQVLIYVRDPLRGVLYDQVLQGSVSLAQTEFTVQAVPYYFANSSIQGGTAPYVWQLNNENTTGPQTADGILTLRQSGSGAGRAALSVEVQNTDPDKYVQTAKAALQILFGGATNSSFSSFFGL